MATDPVTEARSNRKVLIPLRDSIEGHASGLSLAMQEVATEHRFPQPRILTRNRRLQELIKEAGRAARSDATILLTGETGTGKELLATQIHRLSRRSRVPMTVINCAALSDPLVENELFGHVRGAFTGADRTKQGFFETADGGTVFLDEIGDISPVFQMKLLRVLEQGEFHRVGDTRPFRVDLRFIAATNQELDTKVREGNFREDLYYRLNVLSFRVPPLRDRPEDIEVLTKHFVQLFAQEAEKNICWVNRDVFEVLMRYAWPGNVRELRNLIHRAVIVCEGDALTIDCLPADWPPNGSVHPGRGAWPDALCEHEFLCPFKEAKERFLTQFEREYLIFHLRLNHGNVARTAQRTGIYGANLYEKLKRYQIDPNDYRIRNGNGTVIPMGSQHHSKSL